MIIQKSKQIYILLMLAAFGLGLAFGQNVKSKSLPHPDIDLFWSTWDTVAQKYPFEEPTNDEKIYGAIQGLIKSYDDRHMSFLPPVENEYFNQNISGEFGGVGMEVVAEQGYMIVVAPLAGSPAEKAGLLPRDIITHVDEVDVTELGFDSAINHIRGKIGTKVVITVLRSGEEEPLDVSITRDLVKIPTLDTKIVDGVFIISLYNFNEVAEDLFRDALIEYRRSGLKYLLLNLENNPGGFLSGSINISSYFLEDGLIVLKEDDGTGDVIEYRSKGYDILDGYDYNLGVIINEGSASASEIVAGALQDHNLATIYGVQSFGKGSVQELVDLGHDTSAKITIARWLTPNDHQISGVGITPDVEVSDDLDLITSDLKTQ